MTAPFADVDSLRRRIMSAVRGTDTKPELAVRCLVHAMGYRYRLHRKDLPGKPDLVFAGRRKVVFVHGCFWHRHESCRKATEPKTRADFWAEKFKANVARDRRVEEELSDQGWTSLVIWECETKDTASLAERLKAFLAVVPDTVSADPEDGRA